MGKLIKNKRDRKVAFVVYSDIHHNVYNQFNDNDRRIKVSIKAELDINLKARILKCPLLFIGDLFQNEKYISNKLLHYTLPHFSKIWGNKSKTKTYAISGNHDQSEQNTLDNISPSYVNTLSNTFENLVCMDFKSEVVNNVVIHGIPYLSHDIGLLKCLKKIKKSKTKKNILMLHTTLPNTQDTDGRKVEVTSTMNNKIMKIINSFDLVLVGHIHKPMVLSDNILQVGATNQQRKTDRDCKLGYWLIYTDLTFEFVELKAPKFIKMKQGDIKPDNFNYYYTEIENIPSVEKTQDNKPKKFANLNNRVTLAKNYIKVKGIKEKERRLALEKALKSVD